MRNSRINNIWGQEETTTVSKFYLKRAEKFTLDIVITSTEFLAALNGKHLFAFVFRIPLAKVKVLQVEGEVDIYECKYGNVNVYPNPVLQTDTLVVPTGEGQDDKKWDDQKLVGNWLFPIQRNSISQCKSLRIKAMTKIC